jgi:hypothetical protein
MEGFVSVIIDRLKIGLGVYVKWGDVPPAEPQEPESL